MAAVHEVVARDGTCLYRGCDVELACEVYGAAPAETRLLCPRAWTAADERHREQPTATTDVPVPYALTMAGYAATAHVVSRPVDQRIDPQPAGLIYADQSPDGDDETGEGGGDRDDD
jgi:hypothetical protein